MLTLYRLRFLGWHGTIRFRSRKQFRFVLPIEGRARLRVGRLVQFGDQGA